MLVTLCGEGGLGSEFGRTQCARRAVDTTSPVIPVHTSPRTGQQCLWRSCPWLAYGLKVNPHRPIFGVPVRIGGLRCDDCRPLRHKKMSARERGRIFYANKMAADTNHVLGRFRLAIAEFLRRFEMTSTRRCHKLPVRKFLGESIRGQASCAAFRGIRR